MNRADAAGCSLTIAPAANGTARKTRLRGVVRVDFEALPTVTGRSAVTATPCRAAGTGRSAMRRARIATLARGQ